MMMWTKTKTAIKDVFAGANFGEPGDLQNYFRNEYRSEYKAQSRMGTEITDTYVSKFISKHGL